MKEKMGSDWKSKKLQNAENPGNEKLTLHLSGKKKRKKTKNYKNYLKREGGEKVG